VLLPLLGLGSSIGFLVGTTSQVGHARGVGDREGFRELPIKLAGFLYKIAYNLF
jgi:hypothetical protein